MTKLICSMDEPESILYILATSHFNVSIALRKEREIRRYNFNNFVSFSLFFYLVGILNNFSIHISVRYYLSHRFGANPNPLAGSEERNS